MSDKHVFVNAPDGTSFSAKIDSRKDGSSLVIPIVGGGKGHDHVYTDSSTGRRTWEIRDIFGTTTGKYERQDDEWLKIK